MHLFVVGRGTSTGTLAVRLEEALRTRLRPLAVPSGIHVVDELPLNAAGKVDKTRLRAMLSE